LPVSRFASLRWVFLLKHSVVRRTLYAGDACSEAGAGAREIQYTRKR
jgi:hypothetical protein